MSTVPRELESANAKLVYLYLITTGGATPEEIADELAIKTLTLLPLLRRLQEGGFVARQHDRYVPT